MIVSYVARLPAEFVPLSRKKKSPGGDSLLRCNFECSLFEPHTVLTRHEPGLKGAEFSGDCIQDQFIWCAGIKEVLGFCFRCKICVANACLRRGRERRKKSDCFKHGAWSFHLRRSGMFELFLLVVGSRILYIFLV